MIRVLDRFLKAFVPVEAVGGFRREGIKESEVRVVSFHGNEVPHV